jgi:autophagy-related protein 16
VSNCVLFQEAHDGEINDVKWSPNGQLFATGGSDRKLKLYAIQQGKQELKATLTGCNQAIMRIDFDTDGAQVLGASNDFAIRIWGIDDQRCRVRLI